ncbi:hypothetical protein ACTXM1_24850 [Pseudomonas helleri]|uniref:hypothetical protein n=1 Tax=Pseudomonas helleri TaxID=1608996 RepID=UPI003FD1633E
MGDAKGNEGVLKGSEGHLWRWSEGALQLLANSAGDEWVPQWCLEGAVRVLQRVLMGINGAAKGHRAHPLQPMQPMQPKLSVLREFS